MDHTECAVSAAGLNPQQARQHLLLLHHLFIACACTSTTDHCSNVIVLANRTQYVRARTAVSETLRAIYPDVEIPRYLGVTAATNSCGPRTVRPGEQRAHCCLRCCPTSTRKLLASDLLAADSRGSGHTQRPAPLAYSPQDVSTRSSLLVGQCLRRTSNDSFIA